MYINPVLSILCWILFFIVFSDILISHKSSEDDIRLQHAVLSTLRNLVVPQQNKPLAIERGILPVLTEMLPTVTQYHVVFKLLASLRMLVDKQGKILPSNVHMYYSNTTPVSPPIPWPLGRFYRNQDFWFPFIWYSFLKSSRLFWLWDLTNFITVSCSSRSRVHGSF